ncbi:hypothetical protein KUL49_37900 [Alteromonas sp. KUL49]|nr:hypothetical protein KUL49_37900 [Alteromonas sp. KUL49]
MDDQPNNLFELIDGNETLKRLLSELGVFAVNYKDNRVLSNQLWKNWGYTEKEMSLDNDWMNNIHPEDKAETLVKRIHLEDNAKNDMQREIYRYRKKMATTLGLFHEENLSLSTHLALRLPI